MKNKIVLSIVIILLLIFGFDIYQGRNAPSVLDTDTSVNQYATAYFAGGCFWCTESDFEKIDGVIDVVSGYAGGTLDNPTYNQVAGGQTDHREAVKVTYDPDLITFKLLSLELIAETDPTDPDGSFFDRGFQYTSAIFYQNETEKETAENLISELNKLGIFEKEIVTAVDPINDFWVAEDYHQDYYIKNPIRYKYYRNNSGRDAFIDSVWGSGEFDHLFENPLVKTSVTDWENYEKPTDEFLKKSLSALQYKVTQHEGTETPFNNEYWNNKDEGIYVDIVSGEPLFSSTEKFDSGTGWPSFYRPIDYGFVTKKLDFKLIYPRTEIRSKYADSHLGHIILDGPEWNDKIRYCMNSAAMRFVALSNMDDEGYGEYLYIFQEPSVDAQ